MPNWESESAWTKNSEGDVKFVKNMNKKNLKIPKGNQNLYIEEEQTTQWQKKKYKRTNNDLQNIHIKLKI